MVVSVLLVRSVSLVLQKSHNDPFLDLGSCQALLYYLLRHSVPCSLQLWDNISNSSACSWRGLIGNQVLQRVKRWDNAKSNLHGWSTLCLFVTVMMWNCIKQSLSKRECLIPILVIAVHCHSENISYHLVCPLGQLSLTVVGRACANLDVTFRKVVLNSLCSPKALSIVGNHKVHCFGWNSSQEKVHLFQKLIRLRVFHGITPDKQTEVIHDGQHCCVLDPVSSGGRAWIPVVHTQSAVCPSSWRQHPLREIPWCVYLCQDTCSTASTDQFDQIFCMLAIKEPLKEVMKFTRAHVPHAMAIDHYLNKGRLWNHNLEVVFCSLLFKINLFTQHCPIEQMILMHPPWHRTYHKQSLNNFHQLRITTLFFDHLVNIKSRLRKSWEIDVKPGSRQFFDNWKILNRVRKIWGFGLNGLFLKIVLFVTFKLFQFSCQLAFKIWTALGFIIQAFALITVLRMFDDKFITTVFNNVLKIIDVVGLVDLELVRVDLTSLKVFLSSVPSQVFMFLFLWDYSRQIVR